MVMLFALGKQIMSAIPWRNKRQLETMSSDTTYLTSPSSKSHVSCYFSISLPDNPKHDLAVQVTLMPEVLNQRA